jgi:hypothetical protein
MRNALYDAYQMAGALGAGEKALDNFYAAASGKKPPHDDVLPLYIPLWETEMQTRIVHLQEKLLETDAELLYETETSVGERDAWREMDEKIKERYRQRARERLMADGILLHDEHEQFHGHPWYYLKYRRKHVDEETGLTHEYKARLQEDLEEARREIRALKKELVAARE